MQAQAGAGDGAPGQQQRGQQQGTSWRGLIFQVVVMYLVFNYFFGSNTQKAALDPSTGKALEPHHPLWHGGERLQLRVFASEQKVLSPADLESLPPLWAEDDLYYDYRPSNERVRDIVYKPSPVRAELASQKLLFLCQYVWSCAGGHGECHALGTHLSGP